MRSARSSASSASRASPCARRARGSEKPQVSAFTSAKIDRDPRAAARPRDRLFRHPGRHRAGADPARRRGLDQQPPLGRRHRSRYVRRLGAMVGASARADVYADQLEAGLDEIARAAAQLPRRPRIYFEEWDEPPISAIRWVSELIGIAGGTTSFRSVPKLRWPRNASSPTRQRSCARIRTSSWAPGAARSFRPEQVAAREGWQAIAAVRDGEIHEIKSPLILQPGPAALSDGVRALQQIVAAWAARPAR